MGCVAFVLPRSPLSPPSLARAGSSLLLLLLLPNAGRCFDSQLASSLACCSARPFVVLWFR